MDPEKMAAARAWATQALGPVDLHPIKVRPWGATWRIERPGGAVDAYLKCSTPSTGHEAALLRTLARVCPDHVPHLIAADPPAHRLIVADAGTVLGEAFPSDRFDPDIWTGVLERFARLQRSMAAEVDDLIDQGVPDERAARHPHLLRVFAASRQLPPQERARLTHLAEHWETNTAQLSDSPVPPSVQHGDLHGKNVAVGPDGVYRFFDFGDACVAHPFATMDVPLRAARDGGADAATVTRLEDAYLDAFTDLLPLAELRRHLHAVLARTPLHRAHAWARALSTTAPDSTTEPDSTIEPDGMAVPVWDTAAAVEWGDPVGFWLRQLDRT